MKVIFLDIDGVLNVIGQGHDKYGQTFHKHFEDNLRTIIVSTGAKIVISSSWRYSGLESLLSMWNDRQLPGDIIDITPNEQDVVQAGLAEFYDSVGRGSEIQLWLNQHPEVEQYVIIDDDDDMLSTQLENFVKTSGNFHHKDCVDIGYGLTIECAQKAIQILDKKEIRPNSQDFFWERNIGDPSDKHFKKMQQFDFYDMVDFADQYVKKLIRDGKILQV